MGAEPVNPTNNSTYNSQVPAQARPQSQPSGTPAQSSAPPTGPGLDYGAAIPGSGGGSTGQTPGNGRPLPDFSTGSWVWGPSAIPDSPFQGSADASTEWAQNSWNNSQTNQWMPASHAAEMFGALPQWQQDLFNQIAESTTSGMDSGESVYKGYVTTAAQWAQQGTRVTPFELAYMAVMNGTIKDKSSGGGGYGGGYGGSAGPQPADPSAIRRAMDQVSMGLIGRTLGDKEFDRYYQSYVSEFSGNPDMDPTQDMIERVRQEGDYQEYQVANKFASALSGVLQGAI